MRSRCANLATQYAGQNISMIGNFQCNQTLENQFPARNQQLKRNNFPLKMFFTGKYEKHFLPKQMVSQSEESTGYILLYFKKTSQPTISAHRNRLYSLDLPSTCLMQDPTHAHTIHSYNTIQYNSTIQGITNGASVIVNSQEKETSRPPPQKKRTNVGHHKDSMIMSN